MLGMSLSSLLENTIAQDFLRGLRGLADEFDNVQEDKFDRSKTVRCLETPVGRHVAYQCWPGRGEVVVTVAEPGRPNLCLCRRASVERRDGASELELAAETTPATARTSSTRTSSVWCSLPIGSRPTPPTRAALTSPPRLLC